MDTRNNVHLQTFRHRCFNVAMDFHPWILCNLFGKDILSLEASMLPWIFIHGYGSCQEFCEKVQVASMLPWIFIHGYWAKITCLLAVIEVLQCCHGFSSMDTRIKRIAEIR